MKEIKDLELEYQEKWCQKVEAFMKKNFPIGTRIKKDGKVYDITGYKISYYQPAYLICSEIIYNEKYISLYDLYDMVDKAEGGEK
ncbi:MAG: hypothetical protein IK135_02560 [Bacteroidales bacterium]|nr:hypothetical protein [Bacteroidales bacterium]